MITGLRPAAGLIWIGVDSDSGWGAMRMRVGMRSIVRVATAQPASAIAAARLTLASSSLSAAVMAVSAESSRPRQAP